MWGVSPFQKRGGLTKTLIQMSEHSQRGVGGLTMAPNSLILRGFLAVLSTNGWMVGSMGLLTPPQFYYSRGEGESIGVGEEIDCLRPKYDPKWP